MILESRMNPFSTRAIIVAGAVSLALIYASQSGSVMRQIFSQFSIQTFPYFRSALASFSDILVMLILVCIAAKRNPVSVTAISGLFADVARPLFWASLIFIPAILISVFATPLAVNFTAYDFGWKSVVGPFSEELLYRGLAVAVLMRWCGWHWIAACLLPALFFGAAHVWQGSDLGSIAGIVAITGMGGLLFGWLFYRWNFNIWPPVLLHIGMNSLWMIFSFGDTAIGDWFGNVVRLAVVIAAIILTLKLAPPRNTLSS